MSATTATTLAKAAAIKRGLTLNRYANLPLLLAKLTSANKEEREDAKKTVRGLAVTGQAALAADQNAEQLREFANRQEPGQIAP